MPSASERALGKEFFLKKNSNFAECRPEGTRQRIFFKKKSNFAERRPVGTRQRIFFKKNKKSLPSAYRVGTRQSDRQRGRSGDGRFSLPSAPGALGKAFAECPMKDTRQRELCRSIFLPCVLCRVPHSTKNLNPVVSRSMALISIPDLKYLVVESARLQAAT